MRLIIFGGTGEAGRQLIDKALAGGDTVTAFVRQPSRLQTRHDRLSIVQGELHDTRQIQYAINGADAVISLLGPRPREGLENKPLSQGTQNIIAAMKKSGLRRLIVVSTPSARAPEDLFDMKFKALVSIIRTTMRAAYEEIVGIAQAVQASELEWTIVRVSTLNNRVGSGKVRVGYLGRGEVGVQLSRADMVDFILDELQNEKYVGKMPAISN